MSGDSGAVRTEVLADDLTMIDVEWGAPLALAVALLDGGTKRALVDPGPASVLPRLRRGLETLGLGIADINAVLLTHIHLDHAGTVGSLVRDNPRLEVFVHERGARHLVDPARLLASARRIYGERMDELWGEVLPVPAENVRVVTDGDHVQVGERHLEVAYTPGHASHHAAYFEPSTSTAFVGDVGGICIEGRPLVLPTTPPPDIDLGLWEESIAGIRAWRPSRLFLSHFGPTGETDAHLTTLLHTLRDWGERVRASLSDGREDAERARRFAEAVRAEVMEQLQDPEVIEAYLLAADPKDCWHGLARYWRKREDGHKAGRRS